MRHAGFWSDKNVPLLLCDWCDFDSVNGPERIDKHEQEKHPDQWLAREIAREDAMKLSKNAKPVNELPVSVVINTTEPIAPITDGVNETKRSGKK